MSLAAGVLLLTVALADLAQTTLGGQRAGRLARSVTELMWRVFRLLRRLAGRPVHRYCGPAMLALLMAFYIALHWLAWTLIYHGAQGSVVTASDGAPVDLFSSAAYVIAALSTLGASTLTPSGPFWDLVSGFVAINGLIVLTLSMTFVVNITSAVAAGRAFALLVSTRDATDPAHFDAFEERLAELATQLSSFPLALYFSSPEPERRAEAAIARFTRNGLTQDNVHRLRPILAALPGVDGRGDVERLRREVEDWAAVYMLRRSTLDELAERD